MRTNWPKDRDVLLNKEQVRELCVALDGRAATENAVPMQASKPRKHTTDTNWMKFRDEPLARAFKAHFRAGEGRLNWPSRIHSGIEEQDGKHYVALRNSHATLAVYQIQNSGRLKRLDEWPAALKGW